METKESILKIALKLFIEKGFFEVSIRDLIEKADIGKNDFYAYFKSKDKLMCESIEKFFFQRFDEIFTSNNKADEPSKEKLLRIFRKYSEIESYLNSIIRVDKINYNSIICLIVEGIKTYEATTNYIINFNKRLLIKIESIIDEGKIAGEILSAVDSKSTATSVFTSLQSLMVLWAMNQNINMKMLFDTNFKYLWNTIKVSENSLVL